MNTIQLNHIAEQAADDNGYSQVYLKAVFVTGYCDGYNRKKKADVGAGVQHVYDKGFSLGAK